MLDSPSFFAFTSSPNFSTPYGATPSAWEQTLWYVTDLSEGL